LENVIAVVSDDPLELEIPSFNHKDINGITDVIEEQVISPLKTKGL
jgi:hypothetical protein